jgi:hypothetical protein
MKIKLEKTLLAISLIIFFNSTIFTSENNYSKKDIAKENIFHITELINYPLLIRPIERFELENKKYKIIPYLRKIGVLPKKTPNQEDFYIDEKTNTKYRIIEKNSKYFFFTINTFTLYNLKKPFRKDTFLAWENENNEVKTIRIKYEYRNGYEKKESIKILDSIITELINEKIKNIVLN